MLMHTKGILVMTPDSAMVLTGKQSLDFSGGVSAEDNFGIGGYDRVMGPNGQAQYWAPDLAGACDVLMAHYDHTYVAPGRARPTPRRDQRPDGPRRLRLPARHPGQRLHDGRRHLLLGHQPRPQEGVRHPHPDARPSPTRTTATLERWAGMADAETAVVQDAHLGGIPVCLLGIESKTVPRRGFPPTDGPDTYTAGTLFPRSSKKAARAINAASGNRPLVVLANLSGFDGSPDSMRSLQLEYGAEIGRAIVNFEGPIVFCVVSPLPRRRVRRVLQGAQPADDRARGRGLVRVGHRWRPGRGRRVRRRRRRPHRRRPAGQATSRPGSARPAAPSGPAGHRAGRAALGGALARSSARSPSEFDGVHSIHRAVEVGSVDAVITGTSCGRGSSPPSRRGWRAAADRPHAWLTAGRVGRR